MNPKPPVRPKVPKSPDENTPTGRDTTPDILPRLPVDLADFQPGQTPGQPLPPSTHRPLDPPPAFEIIDLPRDTHISRVAIDRPISAYFIPPRIVERLPEPDPQSGFRSIVSGRQYGDLVEGATVHLGPNAEGLYRAKLLTELIPSGPRLERVQGTSKWRQVEPAKLGPGDSELTLKRVPEAPQSQPDPSKRPRIVDEGNPRDAEPWISWGIADHHASPEDVMIDGVRYKTLPRGTAPDHPIVYIKNPAHLVYDFDLMQSTLARDLEQQPRGAIQVPPSNRWEIDANLPFEKTLTEQVATFLPDLTETSLLSVAKEQFLRANGSNRATGVGLTTLRQVFNDWKTSNLTPRPELADPLLMLPIKDFFQGTGTTRKLELNYLALGSPLHRLEFAPHKFREQWDYLQVTQGGSHLKGFMARLLARNGYKVFDPTPTTTYPALVFTRPGHDFVFYVALHRARGSTVALPLAGDRAFSSDRLPDQIGLAATLAVRTAHAVGKLIHLYGGSQVWSGHADVAYMVRTNDPSI